MRSARILLFLLLVAGGAIAFFGFRNGWELPPVPTVGETPAVTPVPQQAKASDAVRPTFDVVRAEPTGELIMAGRAEPGSTVIVENNGRAIGSTQADANGEWLIQPETPIGKGEHSLQLKSQSSQGNQVLFSKQRLALSLGDGAKSRPLVALTEEGEATRVLQMAPAASDEKRPDAAGASVTANLQNPPFKPADPVLQETPTAQVSFTSIDYEQVEGRNTVFVTGRGTPGTKLMLYIDNEFVGLATVDATGSWVFKIFRDFGVGSHVVRADSVEIANGKVAARAEVNFDRQGPKAVASASAGQLPLVPREAPGEFDAGSAAGAGAGVKVSDSSGSVGDVRPDPGVIIVRRGDTLWQIAQRHYGNGAKYTQIFQNNKNQIRNPNRIYPSQRFNVPR
jgi:hypothetical protein